MYQTWRLQFPPEGPFSSPVALFYSKISLLKKIRWKSVVFPLAWNVHNLNDTTISIFCFLNLLNRVRYKTDGRKVTKIQKYMTDCVNGG
jgi:hypothetical protein